MFQKFLFILIAFISENLVHIYLYPKCLKYDSYLISERNSCLVFGSSRNSPSM